MIVFEVGSMLSDVPVLHGAKLGIVLQMYQSMRKRNTNTSEARS